MKTLSVKLLSDSPLNLTFQEKMLRGVQKRTHSYGSALFFTFAPTTPEIYCDALKRVKNSLSKK